MVLDASFLYTQYYKERIKGKRSYPGKGVEPYPIHWCCSYWKGDLQVIVDYGRVTFNILVGYEMIMLTASSWTLTEWFGFCV